MKTHGKHSKNRTILLSLVSLLILLTFVLTPTVAHTHTDIISANTILLAVSENGDGELRGGTAQLKLEIVPGSGRVFIDTFPLSQIDTQVSTRNAQSFACEFLEMDCTTVDFIYTITSGSSIIGGPSAGAVMSILTIGLLDGEPLRKDIAMTGTISHGGFIGPVGGVKQKIEAASRSGVKTVLIPYGERVMRQQNTTSDIWTSRHNDSQTEVTFETSDLDLIAYGETLGVTVVEVSHIYDALPYYIQKEYPLIQAQITPPEYYESTMAHIATLMCTTTQNLMQDVTQQTFTDNTTNTTARIIDSRVVFSTNVTEIRFPDSNVGLNQTFTQAHTLYEQGLHALSDERYYSAASFCYGAALNVRFLTLVQEDVDDVRALAQNALDTHNLDLDNYKTITDLQTYMLVNERLAEAQNHFSRGVEFENNSKTLAINQYAAAIERVESAKAWSLFYQGFGETYDFDTMQASCMLRLRELDERYNYLQLYIGSTGRIGDNVALAQQYATERKYEACLHKASLTKAEIDTILSTATISRDNAAEVANQRLIIVEQIILRQIEKGNFPIIGYSYYEYAKSLIETDPSSSLLYLGYALELANMDIYFAAQDRQVNINTIADVFTKSPYYEFAKGVALGIILGAIFLFASLKLSREI